MRDGRHDAPSLQHLPGPERDDHGAAEASVELVESYRRLADVFHDIFSKQCRRPVRPGDRRPLPPRARSACRGL